MKEIKESSHEFVVVLWSTLEMIKRKQMKERYPSLVCSYIASTLQNVVEYFIIIYFNSFYQSFRVNFIKDAICHPIIDLCVMTLYFHILVYFVHRVSYSAHSTPAAVVTVKKAASVGHAVHHVAELIQITSCHNKRETRESTRWVWTVVFRILEPPKERKIGLRIRG